MSDSHYRDFTSEMQKKKILYVITKGNFGGAQRYVFDLATNISQEEFEPIVLFGEGDTLGIKLKEAGVRTIHISSLKRNIGVFSDIRAFFTLWNTFLKEKPQVIHLNSSKAGLLGGLAGRLSGVKHIIFTGHGWAFNEERRFFVKLLFLKLHWLTILFSHTTIAVSKRTADQISRLPFVKRKIKSIHNGIEQFTPITQIAARNVLAKEVSARIWIGTISELHKSKGIDYLLHAFAPLATTYANAILVIVGGGEEEGNLKEIAHQLGIEDRVIFTGFIPDARMYLKAFDITTLTSRTEAFPYAILESGIAELPVVASWVGGIPEIITNKESGLLVDPARTEKLSSALEELIVRGELRSTLGLALHEHVITSFTLERMIKQTEALY